MKRKKSTILTIILLLLFAIIALGGTYFLAKQKTIKKEVIAEGVQPEIEEPKKEISKVSNIDSNLIIKLDDLFEINNIKFEEQLYSRGNTWQQEKYNEATEQIEYIDRNFEEVHYIAIDGLKDKDIQENINRKIENTAKKLLLDKKDDGICIYTEVQANFNNILSIVFCKVDYSNSNLEQANYYGWNKGWDTQDTSFLNFDLTTGEEFKFEDLFIEKGYIKSVLTKELYDYFMAKFGAEGGPAYTYDYNKNTQSTFLVQGERISISDIEDNVFMAINTFNKEKEHSFLVGESGDIYLVCYFRRQSWRHSYNKIEKQL